MFFRLLVRISVYASVCTRVYVLLFVRTWRLRVCVCVCSGAVCLSVAVRRGRCVCSCPYEGFAKVLLRVCLYSCASAVRRRCVVRVLALRTVM